MDSRAVPRVDIVGNVLVVLLESLYAITKWSKAFPRWAACMGSYLPLKGSDIGAPIL